MGGKLNYKYWYDHVVISVETSPVEPIVKTENKMDIIMRDNDKGTRMLMDVAI